MNYLLCRRLRFYLTVAFTVALTIPGWSQDKLDAWPSKVIPQPLGVQLKPHNMEAKFIDEVKALGIPLVRRGFHWNRIEKEKGTYDWSLYDRFVADCEARGIRILGMIGPGNSLYPQPWEKGGPEAYAKFAADLVTRYRGKDIIWEIWNEPNVPHFWRKDAKRGNTKEFAEEYYGLVKVAAPAIKQASPESILLAGSVSNMWSRSYEWMDHIFAMGVLDTGIDGWSVHPYGVKSPEMYLEAYQIVRDMMVKHGGSRDFPMANTERGFPTKHKEGFAGGDPKMAHEYQSWHLVRQYLIDLLCGIEFTIWYEFHTVRDKPFSLINGDKKEPAYFACQYLLKTLDGYSLDQRIDLQAELDFALRFTHPDGGVRIVAWTGPPRNQTADKAVPHDVEIPVEGAGTSVTVTDIYGRESKPVPVRAGKVTVRLTGAPVYLTVRP
ncbi:MAG: cellulase family glycosylhydrolase [Verrucomicrobiota bacterium]